MKYIIKNGGARKIYRAKGKNCCLDCKYCKKQRFEGTIHKYDYCAMSKTVSSLTNRNFPFDNTGCDKFEEK